MEEAKSDLSEQIAQVVQIGYLVRELPCQMKERIGQKNGGYNPLPLYSNGPEFPSV